MALLISALLSAWQGKSVILKSNPSKGKDGLEDDSGTTGFSWFPGYALDLEKGIRLDMMFGESSDHLDDNGDQLVASWIWKQAQKAWIQE